ncbi:DegV family protein with EDD domain [Mobilisporobacter senegalensis]|uniref:DegV family protein with EDD domain n=1 Tax=Mobilisporobacter senegalensis TaxID=1329262 RepID=A0A3N1X9Q7_9FIRM|nr:DegV family protein [Mobilisporobacter senegalensis]ROR23455.1 DegV family protein with EDD domain [Mobilisporobacter senegalensis]
MALKIITDSASDVPKWLADEYDLRVIPTPVVIDEKDYFDGETIFPSEFYQLLRDGKEVKTYHINAFMFKENFEPYAKNKDELIYICFSTGIAGTYNAANIAKTELLETYPDFDLTIIDTKCASLGYGLIVYYALKMLENNVEKQTIIEAIKYHCEHMEHIFTVETLEYLYKGGRLSRGSAIAGGLLDIKPIIKVDQKGALVAVEKVRGRQKSLKRLIEIVGEKGAALETQTIGLIHGDDKETLEKVKQKLTEQYGCKNFIENYVGCAIGAHTGPGIIGITFLNSETPYFRRIYDRD